MKTPPRRQAVIKGVRRERLNACVIKDIDDAISFTQKRFNVRRSFVVAVACAHYFGLDAKQEQFVEETRRLRRVR